MKQGVFYLFSIFLILIPLTLALPKPEDWIVLKQFEGVSCISKQFIVGGRGWILGKHSDKGDLILRTTDGGQTWSEYLIKPGADDTFDFRVIHFIDYKEGWITGGGSYDIKTGGFKDKSLIYHTVDGGIHWEPLPVVIENNPFTNPLINKVTFNEIFFIDSREGWITAYARGLDFHGPYGETATFHTFDGGKTWVVQERNIWFIDPPRLFFFSSGEEGWMIGNYIYHITNWGNNWSKVCLNKPRSYPRSYPCWSASYITFSSPMEGWLMGIDAVHYTQDGGVTWKTRQHHLGGTPVRGSFFNGKDGWQVKGDGKLYHTQDGGKTWQMLSDGGLKFPFGLGSAHYLPMKGRIITSASGSLLMYAHPVIGVQPAGKRPTTWGQLKSHPHWHQIKIFRE